MNKWIILCAIVLCASMGAHAQTLDCERLLGQASVSPAQTDRDFLDFYEEKIVHAYHDKFPGQFNVRERAKKIFEGENPYGLSEAEITAIVGYTGIDFDFINTTLRGEIRPNFNLSREDTNTYTAMLVRALSHFPDYHGTAYRYINLPPEALAIHTEGSVVTYNAFSSSTLPDGPRQYFQSSADHEFEIQSLKGKLIEKYSYSPEEKEVLFLPGSKFKIIGRIPNGRRRISIKMVQVE